MEIREVFARKLKVARRAKGLSQEELAYRAGIDRTFPWNAAFTMRVSMWWIAWQWF
jgi:transcriptional regulator with XRE-family HTH domain